MTALCAKTAYEGSYTAWTAGGYCAASAGPRTVVFEKLPPGSGPMDELIKDIYLVCQHSCQCLEGDYETIVNQGRPARAVVEAQENTNRQMEIGDPVYAPLTKPLAPRARLHNTYPPVGAGSHVHVPAYFIPEVDARHLGPGERISETNAATTLWLSPPDGSWAPECSGDFERATFGLPSVTAQEACAADWFGGNIRGNAGLVCKPPTTIMPIDHLFTDESVCHPVYRGLAVNQQGNDDIYKYTIRECRLSCRCVKPEKPAAPPQTVLVEGIFDAARDFIHGVCRVNQIKSAVSNAFACTGLTGSSRGGSKYRNMNVAVRRNQLCSTQKVNGFALAASLAAQQLCYESTRGIRGNSQMG
ncbi:MAG: hypothetical protein M1814_002180 [Vezdaea aestivalis]|nr:MAG: hypothetical protein M1814_002180 [Vezdaea aestivalis]